MITQEKITITTIPCRYIKTSEKHKRNVTIFMYHGWGSSVDNQLFFANILAKEGYDIIIPEILHHDSRQPLENHFIQTITESYFWETIVHTVSESEQLIDGANKNGYLNNKIVVLGSSMGGFIASGAFMYNSVIDGLININGSGAWLTSEKEFQKNSSRTDPLISQIENMDPINALHLIKERPVLLLHGESDSIVSPIGQQVFYDKVIKMDGEQKNVILNIFPNVNHTITLSMIEMMVTWLNRWF